MDLNQVLQGLNQVHGSAVISLPSGQPKVARAAEDERLLVRLSVEKLYPSTVGNCLANAWQRLDCHRTAAVLGRIGPYVSVVNGYAVFQLPRSVVFVIRRYY